MLMLALSAPVVASAAETGEARRSNTWRTAVLAPARVAALVLAVFTLAATFIFHAYWAVPADMQMVQQLMFFKNMAVVGGLLDLFMQLAFGVCTGSSAQASNRCPRWTQPNSGPNRSPPSRTWKSLSRPGNPAH